MESSLDNGISKALHAREVLRKAFTTCQEKNLLVLRQGEGMALATTSPAHSQLVLQAPCQNGRSGPSQNTQMDLLACAAVVAMSGDKDDGRSEEPNEEVFSRVILL